MSETMITRRHLSRSRKILIAAALAAAAFMSASWALPAAVAEVRAPGTFAEARGTASNEVPPSADFAEVRQWLVAEAEQVLDGLPGGADINVYAYYDVIAQCGLHAIACSSPGGDTIWVSTFAGARMGPVVTHEYMHLQANPSENLWLRFHANEFPEIENTNAFSAGLEGVADCGVQLLLPETYGELPYMPGACTARQLALASAVLYNTPLSEVL